MMSIYTISAILTVGNEYMFSEYMSLSKNDIIDRFASFERNGFEILRAKMMIGDAEVNFTDYTNLYNTICNLNDDLDYSMTR